MSERTKSKADERADVPQGPGLATTPEATTAAPPEPAEVVHPSTSGDVEDWAIPQTPGHKQDRDAALKESQANLERMAERGQLPPPLAKTAGPGGKTDQDRREKIVAARRKVQELNEKHPVTEAIAAAKQIPELPALAPPATARAVMQKPMSRYEMQANGISDDMLANADALGVDRIALCHDGKLRQAVRDYIDAVRQNV